MLRRQRAQQFRRAQEAATAGLDGFLPRVREPLLEQLPIAAMRIDRVLRTVLLEWGVFSRKPLFFLRQRAEDSALQRFVGVIEFLKTFRKPALRLAENI